jgi:hypothetical protein
MITVRSGRFDAMTAEISERILRVSSSGLGAVVFPVFFVASGMLMLKSGDTTRIRMQLASEPEGGGNLRKQAPVDSRTEGLPGKSPQGCRK